MNGHRKKHYWGYKPLKGRPNLTLVSMDLFVHIESNQRFSHKQLNAHGCLLWANLDVFRQTSWHTPHHYKLKLFHYRDATEALFVAVTKTSDAKSTSLYEIASKMATVWLVNGYTTCLKLLILNNILLIISNLSITNVRRRTT